MNKIELIRNNCFGNKIILIDGQGRSGKNLISVLLSTMNYMEKMTLETNFDNLPRYYKLGKMSKDAAITALRALADEQLFYSIIGRDVNFRISDYSGVMKQGKRLQYFKRLFFMSDEAAVKLINEGNLILQEMTHDGLHLADIYFEAFNERLKMIHVFRDPIGNIFEQNKRNFGTRIGTDPRELQLSFLWENQTIPLMAMGMEEEYLMANSTERLVLMVNAMYHKNIEGFRNLDEKHKRNVFFIEFEDFVQQPQKYIKKIENFVGDNFGKGFKRILKRENCPRIIEPDERKNRIDSIKKNISEKYNLILDDLIKEYDKKFWINWNKN
jgi:hypothetical protein